MLVSSKLTDMSYYFRLPLITDLTISQQAALNEVEAIAISGGPGTGKSVVSLWRHIRNYDLETRKSLLLTYTKTLERYLAATARAENEDAAEHISRTYWWTTHNGTDQYDEIIVDEAQDVKLSKYKIIRNCADSVSYGIDKYQSVFLSQDELDELLTSLPELFPTQNFALYENFRNSYEIIQFVRALFPNRLIPQTTVNTLLKEGRRGNKPILLITNKNSTKQSRAIVDIINQFRDDTHNIAILVPLQRHVDTYCNILDEAAIECSRFVTDDGNLGDIDNVHITTFKSSKGTEFDTVIIPDFENMRNNIANLRVIEESDYYVALTRARRNLYLISSVDLAYLNQLTIQKETL